jgi:prepilin-type N-terminal cleavage/methylation domain-containing protein
MKRAGFTLIEVLMATVLLAGALMVLGNAMSGSSNAVRKSRSLTTISLLLQRKITEYEIKYKNKSLSELPEKEEGDFGEDFAPYSWTMESKKVTMPDLSSALTARQGGASETEIMIVKQLTDLIEHAVREVKVAVLWKTPVRNLEYSVTTYFVDNDQANLGGAAAGGAGATTGGTGTGTTGSTGGATGGGG